jgi:hypothetical protein
MRFIQRSGKAPGLNFGSGVCRNAYSGVTVIRHGNPPIRRVPPPLPKVFPGICAEIGFSMNGEIEGEESDERTLRETTTRE